MWALIQLNLQEFFRLFQLFLALLIMPQLVESLLLELLPVFVELPSALITDGLSNDISHNSYNSHWRSLDDGDRLDSLLFCSL